MYIIRQQLPTEMPHSMHQHQLLRHEFLPIASSGLSYWFVGRGHRRAVRLRPTSGNGERAMATVYVVTAGSGESYRIERIYLDSEQAYGFAQDYNGIAPVEPVQVEEWQVGDPAGRL